MMPIEMIQDDSEDKLKDSIKKFQYEVQQVNEKLQRSGQGCLQMSMSLKIRPFKEEDEEEKMSDDSVVIVDDSDGSGSEQDDDEVGEEWKSRLLKRPCNVDLSRSFNFPKK